MKQLIYLFISTITLFSLAASACPDLTGTYVCPADPYNPTTTSDFSQKIVNGITIYDVQTLDANGNLLNSGSYIADGVTRNIPVGNGYVLPESYTCDGDADVRMNSNFIDPRYGEVWILETFVLDSQKNLHITENINYSQYPPQRMERTCFRQ